jgi:hypothetical protein
MQLANREIDDEKMQEASIYYLYTSRSANNNIHTLAHGILLSSIWGSSIHTYCAQTNCISIKLKICMYLQQPPPTTTTHTQPLAYSFTAELNF